MLKCSTNGAMMLSKDMENNGRRLMKMPRRKGYINIYGLYDTFNDECCVFVGTIDELGIKTGLSRNTIYCYVTKNRDVKFEGRYLIRLAYQEKITEKICKICGEIKPIEQFVKKGKGSYSSVCKPCHCEQTKIKRRKEREERKNEKI